MNGPTITMGPTMANPEAFTTVTELRQALHRANNQLLESTDRLHVLSTALSHLAKTLGELLQLHSDGESDALDARLTQLVEMHVRVVGKTPGGMH